MEMCNCVGVSVRCGNDYVNNGWPICSKDFYLSGMRKIKERIDNCTFYTFSDDIDKVKEEKWFSEENVKYIDNLNVCESFDLLRNYRHFVCANSSFSWWGAFLSYSDHAVVYEPNVFYNKKYADDNKRLLYSGLHILDYISGEEYQKNLGNH